MSLLVSDPDFDLHVDDVRDVLRELEPESVHCVVTSPPYWGLRDYGTGEWEGGDAGCDHVQTVQRPSVKSTLEDHGEDGRSPQLDALPGIPFRDVCGKCGATRTDRQLGLEPTPEEYVANMVEVFREVRRVLRADGTCWLNLGDSYNAHPGGAGDRGGRSITATQGTGDQPQYVKGHGLSKVKTLKPKDLVGIPWRVAFALQADGWYLRSDIIWSKPNPMPESVTDRPTKAHEYVFLLTKSPRYFFDQEAVRETSLDPLDDLRRINGDRSKRYSQEAQEQRRAGAFVGGVDYQPPAGRNIRSVWEIATQPYPEAHFATFPQALVEPCIKAGTSERGCCPECGAPWVREVDIAYRPLGDPQRHNAEQNAQRGSHGHIGDGLDGTHGGPQSMTHGRAEKRTTTTGWKPSCSHVSNLDTPWNPAPGVVLDPFLGSGTTALVARRLGRKCIGVELSPEYAELAARRLQQLSLLA